jgi:hypothetical protein
LLKEVIVDRIVEVVAAVDVTVVVLIDVTVLVVRICNGIVQILPPILSV